MDSLYIVMPAYNEEANIENTVKMWYGILEGKDESSRLVIADSGSSDNTHGILLNLREQYPKLLILEDTEKQLAEILAHSNLLAHKVPGADALTEQKEKKEK